MNKLMNPNYPEGKNLFEGKNILLTAAAGSGIGFSTALTPLVAQADGRSDTKRVGELFIHGLFLCIFLGVISLGCVFLSCCS